MDDGGSAVVTLSGRAGIRIGDDRESETTKVGGMVRLDREMGFVVDGISLMSGVAYGAAVSCCLFPSGE
jgi:hypothetical protein